MKKLYASIHIENALTQIEQVVSYYKTKGEKFGIEIIKQTSAGNTQVKRVDNITQNEQSIDNILSAIVRNGAIFSSVDDIVEDFASEF